MPRLATHYINAFLAYTIHTTLSSNHNFSINFCCEPHGQRKQMCRKKVWDEEWPIFNGQKYQTIGSSDVHSSVPRTTKWVNSMTGSSRVMRHIPPSSRNVCEGHQSAGIWYESCDTSFHPAAIQNSSQNPMQYSNRCYLSSLQDIRKPTFSPPIRVSTIILLLTRSFWKHLWNKNLSLLAVQRIVQKSFPIITKHQQP
jgi:hypothetical protein